MRFQVIDRADETVSSCRLTYTAASSDLVLPTAAPQTSRWGNSSHWQELKSGSIPEFWQCRPLRLESMASDGHDVLVEIDDRDIAAADQLGARSAIRD